MSCRQGACCCGRRRDRLNVISPYPFQDISHREPTELGMELLMFLKAEDDLEILLFAAVVQETVVPDFLET